MIELIFIALTTIATISAAIAAWMSYLTSSRALSFQKNYTKNQHLITRLNIIISKLRTLKYMMENMLEISDDKFNSIESIFLEVKAELESLGEIGVFDYSSSKISKIPSLGEMVDHMAKNNAYLFEVIDEVEQKISEVFK
ncbi:hypothetical protein [Methylobacter sp. BBA5.1]|jgi:ABC-type microcin C transport system permease subunit YejE|uniref:hypothetical protein n=1 Tax=Methylobacter sp. BBA5.1 TaxID=1495064 RepID=UPI001267E90B|nr:hypothetical protein [Methylobacter sp. BBA5.1]